MEINFHCTNPNHSWVSSFTSQLQLSCFPNSNNNNNSLIYRILDQDSLILSPFPDQTVWKPYNWAHKKLIQIVLPIINMTWIFDNNAPINSKLQHSPTPRAFECTSCPGGGIGTNARGVAQGGDVELSNWSAHKLSVTENRTVIPDTIPL